MSSKHVWWSSPRDGQPHAILKTQVDGPGDGTVDAECSGVLYLDEVTRSPTGKYCDACLQAVGDTADDHRWR